ncbi:MAG: hypothetical protein Q7T13_01535 [Polaromonas sp.]|nr:hypothetical protein [Polaromonas sp.]
MGLAKKTYLQTLNLNYDASWRGVPHYLRVAKVKLMQKRLHHPLGEHYIYDYEVWFKDGTFDRVSEWERPPRAMPKPDQYYPRRVTDFIQTGSYWDVASEVKAIPGFLF